ncbi:MAG: cytochrome c, partial [Anaerolineae bacterium]
ARGALLFASTCAICHGDNGTGTDRAPALNDPQRLSTFDNDWYRATIRNGRPAKGMPTWGTVLSPNQIEDIIALIDAWRAGNTVQPAFDIGELLDSAIFSLQENDTESAALHINRALSIASGKGADVLENAAAQLVAGDTEGAIATLTVLKEQWPLGEAEAGAEIFQANCAVCHGKQGEGGIGAKLTDNEFIQSLNNADLVAFLLEGRRGTAMAGWEGRLTPEELANVVAFLRTWQP